MSLYLSEEAETARLQRQRRMDEIEAALKFDDDPQRRFDLVREYHALYEADTAGYEDWREAEFVQNMKQRHGKTKAALLLSQYLEDGQVTQ